MSAEAQELEGLIATVDDVLYMPSLDAPTDRPHPFVYFITILNESTETITVKARKWIITQENEEQIVVEGEGVVKQYPVLQSGDNFSYNSYHVIGQDSEAEGSFLCQTESGRVVYARIPKFTMKVPQWA